jgi:hypothetical protein
MVYRTNADPTIEEARAEARELTDVVRAAATRRRRVALAVSAVVATVMSMFFVLPALQERRPQMSCHSVTIRWENAPHVPDNSWTTCRTH